MSEEVLDLHEVHPPRPLRDEERALLDFLLSRAFPGRDELRQQLATAKVAGEVGGGDLSIVLVVDQSTTSPASCEQPLPVEAEGVDEGIEVDVLLFVRHGYLDMLLTYRVDGKPLSRFLTPDALTLIRPSD